MATHEQTRSTRKVAPGSDRSFGLVFAVVFTVIALWPWVFHGAPLRLWAFAVAAAFLIAAFFAPRVLAPLNRLWFRFGELLHKITNPVLMGVVYAAAILPAGLVLKLAGKDLLRLRLDPAAPTYWITRDPPGPEPGSMRNQF